MQERDLPPAPPKLIQLLQPNSMKLLEQLADAKAGDFAVPHDGDYILFRGATGVPFIPIGFAQAFVEWGQGRSGYSRLCSTSRSPADATWRTDAIHLTASAGYACVKTATGSKTRCTAIMLILPQGWDRRLAELSPSFNGAG